MGSQAAVRPDSAPAEHQVAASRFQLVAFQVAIFLAGLLVLFLRRPDALLNAQFYAEDGARWFADAYHIGWRCLLLPESGYLQTVSRLIGLFCQLLPFVAAPLAMNLFALSFQILPVNLFLSSRFAEIPLKARLISSLLYLGLPNSFETHANTTNIQWHLALACCLLLLSRVPPAGLFRFCEWLLLALSVLDGPAGLLLTPVALIVWWIRRDRHSLGSVLALIPGALLQTLVLLLSGTRRPAPNGATLTRFIEILGGQVFLSSILGLRTSIQWYFSHASWLLLAQGLALAIGLAVVAYAFFRATFEIRLFIFYAFLSLSLALIRPVASFGADYPQWQLMETPGVANRYYFIPMLAFFASLIWIATNSTQTAKFMRLISIAVLALLPIGVVRDWRYKPFVDYNFKSFAADFERVAPGTKVSIPINPDWHLILIKH
jgi:hypothetical protein